MDLDDYLALIFEAKKTSRTTITRQTKKMIYYRDLYFKFRNMIHRKYSPRVRSKARR